MNEAQEILKAVGKQSDRIDKLLDDTLPKLLTETVPRLLREATNGLEKRVADRIDQQVVICGRIHADIGRSLDELRTRDGVIAGEEADLEDDVRELRKKVDGFVIESDAKRPPIVFTFKQFIALIILLAAIAGSTWLREPVLALFRGGP